MPPVQRFFKKKKKRLKGSISLVQRLFFFFYLKFFLFFWERFGNLEFFFLNLKKKKNINEQSISNVTWIFRIKRNI